mgnify:CR=1 FL=1
MGRDLACRAEEWGEWMREELLVDVPHRQVVFTIPKMLRLFFRYNRRMRIISFLTDYAVVDRIINHLKLTFIASKPPPPQVAFQEYLVADETSTQYFS